MAGINILVSLSLIFPYTDDSTGSEANRGVRPLRGRTEGGDVQRARRDPVHHQPGMEWGKANIGK